MTQLRIEFINYLKLSSLSEKTIHCYVDKIRALTKHYYRPPETITAQELKDFLVYLKDSGKSDKLIHSFYYSFRKFYQFLNEEEKMDLIPPPRRSYRIPVVLNRGETQQLLNSCINIYEKLYISLLYSTGMRISELTNLKIEEIDFERKTIYISNSKSRNQRFVILSESVNILIQLYMEIFKPKLYLFFKSGNKNLPVSTRRLQDLFQKIVKRSKIKKKITSHTLRHSFATHLLESGTNIVYIQKLLGHSSILSTILYLHIENNTYLKVKSPIDSIDLESMSPNQFQNQPCLNFDK